MTFRACVQVVSNEGHCSGSLALLLLLPARLLSTRLCLLPCYYDDASMAEIKQMQNYGASVGRANDYSSEVLHFQQWEITNNA